MKEKAVVIGSGFAGLSAATSLAQNGLEVIVLEKNTHPGGRARSFEEKGYRFDMGPSWYWMPDVFEQYFQSFGKEVKDYYQLKRLDPSYRIYFGIDDYHDLPAGAENCIALFESIEKGSGEKLRKFLSEAAYKYDAGMHDLVYRPGRSLKEFADWRLASGIFQLGLLKSMRRYVHQNFSNEKLRQIVEFPILFLGGTPKNTPSLYSLMNYADMALGTWYPQGGMNEIVKAMVALAEEKGVRIITDQEVTHIDVAAGRARAVHTTSHQFPADVVIAGADYHHVEQKLLAPQYRQYSPKYWDSRELAPSSLIYYLGVSRKIPGLLHHTLFFDEDFDEHAREIYDDPQWPSRPLFYACTASKSDASIAPEGHENLFLLMPVAPGINDDSEEKREQYYDLMMDRLEAMTGTSIKQYVDFKRSYAHRDFINDYHSFKGNAYGLANTLKQTAVFKPAMKSKHVKNLYYSGQLTVPGPGVPPSLISGQVVAREVMKDIPKSVV